MREEESSLFSLFSFFLLVLRAIAVIMALQPVDSPHIS